MASAGHFPWRHALSYIVVQTAAAFLGVAPAQIMFSLPL
jgi:glycerol uptake facilitator-like aquaporin